MSIVYAMRSEGRARAVAKDLVKVAAEHGLAMKLSAAQKTAAMLFGYSGWAAMTASLQSAAQGPEDHELSADDLEARLAAQRAVLVSAGFDEASSTDVLSRLRPTARSGGAVEARSNLARVVDHTLYHPTRLDDAMWSFVEETGTEIWNLEFWDRNELLAEYVRKSYEGKPSLFADEIARGEPQLFENMLDQAHDFHEENLILDVAGRIGELLEPATADLVSGIDFGQDYLVGMVDEDRNSITHYVHFGDGLFGSPWSDASVQGAYVTFGFDFAVDGLPHVVEVSLIVADRTPPVALAAPMLRNALRGYYHNMIFEENYGLLDAMADLSSPSDDPYEDMWAPYVVDPTVAALRAVALYYRPGQRRVFAVEAGASHEVVALFDRAATFEQSREAVRRSFGRPPVCMLGDPAALLADRTFAIAGPGYEEAPQLSDFEALVEECFAMSTPDGYLFAARKAMELAQDLKSSGECDVLDKAVVLVVGAALAAGDTGLAVDQARQMVGSYVDPSDISVEWRPLLSIALAVGGERAMAEELASFPVHEEDWHDRSSVALEFLLAAGSLESGDERLAELRKGSYLDRLLQAEDNPRVFQQHETVVAAP